MSIDIHKVERKPKYVHLHLRGTTQLEAGLEVYDNAYRIAAEEGREVGRSSGATEVGKPVFQI